MPRATRHASSDSASVVTTSTSGASPLRKALDKGKSYLPNALTERTGTELYLLGYNVTTTVLWSYLLLLVTTHLFSAAPAKSALNPAPSPSPGKASQILAGFFSTLFENTKQKASVASGQTNPNLAKSAELLHALVAKASATYYSRGIGVFALIVQSLAVFEVAHSALGWTRSPLKTTAMQVASRLVVVWWWVERTQAARESPFYSSALICWSVSEIIRDVYYSCSLLRVVPLHTTHHDHSKPVELALKGLTYVRYTAFYALYPLGAASEYALLLAQFPAFPGAWRAIGKHGVAAAVQRVKVWVKEWDLGTWVNVPFLIVWPASLFILMNYMQGQRTKALGHPTHKPRSHKAKRA